MIRHRKKLGQNFLKDGRALDRIVSVLDVVSDDVVIEIGPGHGELTRRALKYNPKELIAIEKDPALIEYFLQKLADEHKSLHIVEGDALIELPRLTNYQLLTTHYKLMGNIPYYITGHLLRMVGDLENKPVCAVFTVQKEVAERVCAQPPRMNLLAASVQIWSGVEVVRYISKKSFSPPPKVDSAVIKIVPRKESPDPSFHPFVHALFSQPRKTILNNLKTLGLTREDIEKGLLLAGIDPKARPQNLNIEEIKQLSLLFTRN
ncbi:MAG: 16S rRNA (adenine(1518)-N(6)/adenine(1519)-N(6))-dimethyltransferase RsmA [Candidatus Colwellbacteria bacterium]|nr:16S rRNA (adenine(1518)-N(6)/adenine(1519)-N(6))-dimethyltransferase RsmA [Candidatus Colwellbacteria bacterium]